MALIGGDRRQARLTGLDRRLLRLLGGDRRAARLTGGDREGKAEAVAAGAVSLEQLLAAGAGAVALPASSARLLAQLQGGAGVASAALPASSARLLAQLQGAGAASAFRPSDVPEVAAGYFWDPLQASGSGAPSFALPEGNGKSSFNMLTPSASTAPVIGTVNGATVVTYTNRTAPSIDDQARTSAKVTRGWTGATYLWGWFVPPVGGCGFVLSHWRTATNFGLQINSSDVRIQASDGTAKEQRFAAPAGGVGAAPVFYEAMFVPSDPSPTNRLQLAFNLAQQTPTVATSFGTTLLDTSEFISFAGPLSDGSGFNITGTYSAGVAGIASGIPSLADRTRLFNHRRLAP